VRQTGVNKEGLLEKCKKLVETSQVDQEKWRPFGTTFN